MVDHFGFVLLEIAGGGHAFAIDVEIADIFQQFVAHLGGINRIATADFAELGRAKDSVFTVLAAGEHAADHVAVDGHHREGGGHVGHADGDVSLGEHGPEGFFLEHVGVGGDAANDEAGNAVLFGIGAGEQSGVDAGAIWSGDGAQFSVGAFLSDAGEVGHLALEEERTDDVQLHAIDADHDYPRLGLGFRSVGGLLGGKSDRQQKHGGQEQGNFT